VNSSIAVKKRDILSQLYEKHRRRFRNIKKAKYQIQLLISLFFFDVEKAPDNIELNRIDHHFNRGLKEKQNSKRVHILLLDFYEIPNTEFSDFGKNMLPVFSASYSWL
jgi:hypothetical protein